MECAYCHKKLEPRLFVQVMERKNKRLTGRKFNYCFDCYSRFFYWELKNLDIAKKHKWYLDEWKRSNDIIR